MVAAAAADDAPDAESLPLTKATATTTDDESIRICAVQPPLRQSDEHPLDATRAALEQIKTVHHENTDNERPIDLFVLPELSPVGYCEDTFQHYLPKTQESQKMYRQIDELFAQTARQLSVFVAYGTIGWKAQDAAGKDDTESESQSSPQPLENLDLFIRHTVINGQGQKVASYDKIHLCDYGDCAETRFFTAGSHWATSLFGIRHVRFGLLICADMRYPMLSQKLVRDGGAHCVLQPAAFSRDLSFYTWKSFRETRAVENGVYWVGVNYAGESYGDTSLVPPWVDQEHLPTVLSSREPGHLLGSIEPSVLEHARTTMPFYRHLMKTVSSGSSGSGTAGDDPKGGEGLGSPCCCSLEQNGRGARGMDR